MKVNNIAFILVTVVLLIATVSAGRTEENQTIEEYQQKIRVYGHILEVERRPEMRAWLFLRRGKAYVDMAQLMRREKSTNPAMGGFVGWPADAEKYREYYALASGDFEMILEKFRGTEEAPEAQFMLGQIWDYPHLNSFEAALEEYQNTITTYPGTKAAEKAKKRQGIIKAIMEGTYNPLEWGEQEKQSP